MKGRTRDAEATRPLRKLTQAGERIGEGYCDCELDCDEEAEVGILTRTFKKIIANLSKAACVDAPAGIHNRMALRHDCDLY